MLTVASDGWLLAWFTMSCILYIRFLFMFFFCCIHIILNNILYFIFDFYEISNELLQLNRKIIFLTIYLRFLCSFAILFCFFGQLL